VKIPKLFVCGRATAVPSAITIERAHTIKNDLLLRTIFIALDPGIARRSG
jgi:hypothetical protein